MTAFAQYLSLISAPRKPKRESRTKAEKVALVEEWKRSGMKQRDFIALHNLPKSSFGFWCAGKALEQHGKNNELSPEVKAKAKALWAAGRPQTRIAKELQISDWTVHRWVRGWKS